MQRIAIVVAFMFGAAVARAETLAEARAAGDAKFAAAVHSLADRATADEAAVLRAWIPARDRRQVLFNVLAKDVGYEKLTPELKSEFASLRAARAKELFAFAAPFADREPTAVYQLLHEVLHEDAEHVATRKILEHERGASGWREKAERPATANGDTDHPKLGWKRGTYRRIQSPHFRIVSQAALGRDDAERLELLYDVWRQVFFRFAARPGALAARIAGGDEPLFKPKQHQIVIFRDRNAYVTALQKLQPKIGLTTGLYDDRDQISYLYDATNAKGELDPTVAATWFHEVTHQLIQETIGDRTTPGENGNFWIVEGLALYFESLTNRGDYCTLGGWDADRLQFVRYFTLAGQKSVGLQALAALSKADVQDHKEIRELYRQAAGFAHLLMDDQGGAYRESTLHYLAAVYQHLARGDALQTNLRTSPAEIDARLPAFLQVRDADLANADAATLKNLSLGRTAVTDAGLLRLRGAKRLEWLDLSGTAVTDEGLAILDETPSLRQLFLERTKVSAASLPRIARLKQLEELDLSGLPIRDADLAALSALSNLKILHLSGTEVSDAGILTLKTLRRMEELRVEQTKVTPQGLERLQKLLPKLNR